MLENDMTDFHWDLFDRYLAGMATPAERKRFEEWLAEDPERGNLVDAFRRAVDALELDVTEQEVEALWEGVAERAGVASQTSRKLHRDKAVTHRVGRVTSRRPAWRAGAGIAAGLAVVGATILAARQFLWDGGDVRLPGAEQVLRVPLGETARLELADGTEVLLGAGSVLTYPGTFVDSIREVTLEGEAYFSVRHSEGQPFRVRAGDLIATEVGTAFLVQAFPEQQGARVVVRSGTVAVEPVAGDRSRPPGHVRPGQLGRIGSTGVPRVEQVDTAAYFAWTTGTLVFDNMPLREALPRLSRWYDLDFHLADTSWGSIPISGRLDRSITPSRLSLLAASVGLEHVRRGRAVTLYRKR